MLWAVYGSVGFEKKWNDAQEELYNIRKKLMEAQ
jgi:hypothetical protein